MSTDTGYTRTVATAVTELVTTLLPQPSLGTAVAILLTGILSPDPTPAGHRPTRPVRVTDEVEYDPYPPSRRSNPPSTGSLWDRFS